MKLPRFLKDLDFLERRTSEELRSLGSDETGERRKYCMICTKHFSRRSVSTHEHEELTMEENTFMRNHYMIPLRTEEKPHYVLKTSLTSNERVQLVKQHFLKQAEAEQLKAAKVIEAKKKIVQTEVEKPKIEQVQKLTVNRSKIGYSPAERKRIAEAFSRFPTKKNRPTAQLRLHQELNITNPENEEEIAEANDGKLKLQGNHRLFHERSAGYVNKRKKNCALTTSSRLNSCNDEKINEEIDESNGDSNDEFSEDCDSEYDSDDEEDGLTGPEDPVYTANEPYTMDYDVPMNSSRRSDPDDQFSSDDGVDMEETVLTANKSNDSNESATNSTTRSGRVLKKRVFEANFNQNKKAENSLICSGTQRKITKESILKTPTSNKRQNDKIPTISAKRTAKNDSSPAHSPKSDELGDYEPNYPFDGSPQYHSRSDQSKDENSIPLRKVKMEPFNGDLIDKELLNAIDDDEDIQVIGLPVIPKQEEEDDKIIEYPKVKTEDLVVSKDEQVMEVEVKVVDREGKDPDEANKPDLTKIQVIRQKIKKTGESRVKTENNESTTQSEVNGNDFVSLSTHIQLLKSLQTMMIFLDTPTLQEDSERIEKRIEKYKKEGNDDGEKVSVNQLRATLVVSLLIVEKCAKTEVIKGEETSSFDTFLRSLQGFIIPLKFTALNKFLESLKVMRKELSGQDKSFPRKKISDSLRTILNIIAP